tara:strand:- start:110467 stop:110706 length:240 start_codon:yes stop_codon:yes gene_type:complete
LLLCNRWPFELIVVVVRGNVKSCPGPQEQAGASRAREAPGSNKKAAGHEGWPTARSLTIYSGIHQLRYYGRIGKSRHIA